MPNSFRDDDKILERPTAGGSKGGWIAVGVVVYLLGIFTGMQVSALMGGGSCPTGPTSGSVAPMVMPAPRAATPPATPAAPPSSAAGEARGSRSPAAVPAVAPEAADPDATFALQVRTFDTLEGAGKLVRRLQAAGYPGYVVTTHLPDGTESHRVRVGDYPDRVTAEAAAAKIAEATSLAPFVTLTLR